MLSDVYLHYLDTIWAKQFAHLGTIIRYADDLVVLCRYKAQAKEAIQVVKAVFQKLELTMNPSKSKLVSLWEGKEGFDFLGHTHRRMPYWGKNGRILYYLRSYPSRKAMKKMRDQVKKAFRQPGRLQGSLQDMIAHLNPKIQGWKNAYATCDPWTANRFLEKVDWYIRRRFHLWWNRKHKKRKAKQVNLFALLPAAGLKTVSTWR